MKCPDCDGDIQVQVISEPKRRSGVLYAIVGLVVSVLLAIIIPYLAAIPAAGLLFYHIFNVPENNHATYAVCQKCGFFIELKNEEKI